MKFYVACLLLGLEHMHDKDMIHRDLKPENLLLDDKGMVIYKAIDKSIYKYIYIL